MTFSDIDNKTFSFDEIPPYCLTVLLKTVVLFRSQNANQVIVYRKGDIVKQPMKKGSFVPKNVPGVGWGGVSHVGVGWGGS